MTDGYFKLSFWGRFKGWLEYEHMPRTLMWGGATRSRYRCDRCGATIHRTTETGPK